MRIYYAVFNFSDSSINVIFPDLNNATTFGQDMHEALYGKRFTYQLTH